MATTTMVQKADSPTLKRSFASDQPPNTFLPSKKCERDFARRSTRPYCTSNSPYWHSNTGNHSPRPEQRSTRPRRPRMVQASSRTFVPPMPTFMSVFGEANNTGIKHLSDHNGTSPHGSSIGRPASSGNFPIASTSSSAFSSFHVHRDSTSTVASESSDSSPTTTISTMDSSSVTEPSPGPSPESPISKAAAPSFSADFRSRRAGNGSSESSPTTFFELQRPTTPAKKARNLKNLGINTSTSLSNLRSNPAGVLPGLANKDKNTSAPTSPSFIKPPTPPKRRPSNLSLIIQTPGSDSKPMRLVIPSGPAANRPPLRHFQSSPALALSSPNSLLSGGMRPPALRPIKTNPHGFAEVPFEQEEEDNEPNFDIPQSREEKPAAYPNGPICIYESGVYLYFEPTAEQATTFDVIVNVASEVKNPFINPPSDSQKDLDARRIDGPPAENVDFAALPERTKPTSFEGTSPTTPKATPVLETMQPGEHVINGSILKAPEYIHMPWEHNTDIVPDLYKLVKTMDERVKQGKRILVHCQCGVSRSASLIVAYGLYKNPGISVQDAYDAVKKRSRWIGPNMNLIMQLQEFRNGLLRQNEIRTHNPGYGFPPRRSAGLSSGVSMGTNARSPFGREEPAGPRTPRTAPLPPDTDINMQRASTGNIMALSPGPLSAPSGVFFSPGFRRSWASSPTHFQPSPKVSPTATPSSEPKGHLVPVLSIVEDERPLAHSESQPEESERSGDVSSPTVPNFSRQLPFRRQLGTESTEESSQAPSVKSEVFLKAPPRAMGLDTLRSPLAASFSIPTLAPTHQSSGPAATMQFNVSSWSQSRDMEIDSPTRTEDYQHEPMMSPRATEFHMTGLNRSEPDDSYDLLSPRAASFNLGPEPTGSESDDFEVTSPTITEFPKDMFARTDASKSDLKSPRAAEFHMAPLKPVVADEDPFGLTSPTRFEFPSNPFEKVELTLPTNSETETRRRSFQAILPPSHLEQPEVSNGFASLNGTAQAQASAPVAVPVAPTEPQSLPDGALGSDESNNTSVSTPMLTTPHDIPGAWIETPGDFSRAQSYLGSQTSSDEPAKPEFAPIRLTKTPEHTHLSTPPKPSTLRTRFSSPNMREQRRLHKLQTEMEAMLPKQPLMSVDDLDALMSPRAEEFTRNPFHFDIQTATDETSPASSTETIKEGHGLTEWKDPQLPHTPAKVAEDPRSPVQTGSSPIVRNIWDVL